MRSKNIMTRCDGCNNEELICQGLTRKNAENFLFIFLSQIYYKKKCFSYINIWQYHEAFYNQIAHSQLTTRLEEGLLATK